MSKQQLIQQIDALLPQTQCGLCDYAGCKPYATAIANEEADINRCPPGGVATLTALGDLLSRDIDDFIPEMESKQNSSTVAYIDEDLCIGCKKCIVACPVDAIIGARKLMHTVIQQECTGCELCIEPCPMDCISLLPVTIDRDKDLSRARYNARNERLASKQASDHQRYKKAKLSEQTSSKKDLIAAAVARSKAKRLSDE